MGEIAKPAGAEPDADILGRLSAADAGSAAPAGAPGAAVPVVDDAAHWIGAAMHFGAVVRTMLAPEVSKHWTDERLHALGVELANCAKHYGVTFGSTLNHPLAKLAVVAFPLAWPLLEPYAKPYLAELTGKKERVVEQPAAPAAASNDAPAAGSSWPDPVKPVAN